MICEYILCGILFVWVVVSLHILGKNGREEQIKNTFYNRLKYYRIYYHDPWKLTMVFVSIFVFIVCLLWIFNVFPIQVENTNDLLSNISLISATIFIILFTLLVLTVQISAQRYTLDFHRRILLNGWFLIYICLFMFSIFFPLYINGTNRKSDDVATLSFILAMFCIILIIPLFSWAIKKTFVMDHIKEEYKKISYHASVTKKHFWVRFGLQELCNVALSAIDRGFLNVFCRSSEYIWEVWTKTDINQSTFDYSIKERVILFWKKLLEEEEEFPTKFVEIGKKKIENSIRENRQIPREKLDIFKEFSDIAKKKGKKETAKKCDEIYNQIKKFIET